MWHHALIDFYYISKTIKLKKDNNYLLIRNPELVATAVGSRGLANWAMDPIGKLIRICAKPRIWADNPVLTFENYWQSFVSVWWGCRGNRDHSLSFLYLLVSKLCCHKVFVFKIKVFFGVFLVWKHVNHNLFVRFLPSLFFILSLPFSSKHWALLHRRSWVGFY